ncbi:MAG: hypothetical protein ACP5K5_03055 [Candidatus Micrarchaeia archaeon]
MASRIAVIDLDGCIIDDINPKFEEKFPMHKGILNSAIRELIFETSHFIPLRKDFFSKLLENGKIDEHVINAMKAMQEKGIELHVVTKHKGLEKEWLVNELGKHGVKIRSEDIHIVNGNKASTINGLGAETVIEDQFDSIFKLREGARIILLERSYNRISLGILKLLRRNIEVIKPEEIEKALQ